MKLSCILSVSIFLISSLCAMESQNFLTQIEQLVKNKPFKDINIKKHKKVLIELAREIREYSESNNLPGLTQSSTMWYEKPAESFKQFAFFTMLIKILKQFGAPINLEWWYRINAMNLTFLDSHTILTEVPDNKMVINKNLLPLIKHGADLNKKEDDNSLLQLAIAFKNKSLVSWLLNHGALPNKLNNNSIAKLIYIGSVVRLQTVKRLSLVRLNNTLIKLSMKVEAIKQALPFQDMVQKSIKISELKSDLFKILEEPAVKKVKIK